MNPESNKRPGAWSEEEDLLIVRDYLAMLVTSQAGLPVNKSATRRALLPKLNNRPEGSIEFKRCNVSAVLVSLGYEYLPGYRPASNYQKSLVDAVQVGILGVYNAGAKLRRV